MSLERLQQNTRYIPLSFEIILVIRNIFQNENNSNIKGLLFQSLGLGIKHCHSAKNLYPEILPLIIIFKAGCRKLGT